MPSSTTTEVTVSSTDDQARLQVQQAAGALIVDGGRRRPFYFDGRFLTADDLTADQQYIRARQADLAQAMGSGVINGLRVGLGKDAASRSPTLTIEPGIGITPGGDLVDIDEAQSILIADLPTSAQLDARLGLKLLPGDKGARSGLYVLALRPIEYSSNPTAAYPTTLDGKRTVRDGDIVEATAITLIPYGDRTGVEDADAKRGRVAREVFFDREKIGAAQQALPLAMLCLEGGALRWLDVAMVRREVGSESTLAAGLTQRPRALLEAWLQQHRDHLDDIDTATWRGGFAAVKRFEVLPPVGPMPTAALRFDTVLGQPSLLQSYFPAQVDCEFTFVPSDELAAMVQDGLALPPIDLHASGDDLDQLALLIVAPVTRQQLEAFKRSLQNVVLPVRAAATGLVAKRSPLESLLRLSQPDVRTASANAVAAAPPTLMTVWQQAVATTIAALDQSSGGRPAFWYLRKRHLPYTAEISSATLRLAGNAIELDHLLNERLVRDGLKTQYSKMTARIAVLARAETVNLLAAPRLAPSANFNGSSFATSDLLRRSVFTALTTRDAQRAAKREQLGHDDVLSIAREFGDPRLGEGFDALLEAADPSIRTALRGPQVVAAVAASGVAPQLDRAVRVLPPARHGEFAAALASAAAGPDAAKRLAELAGATT